MVKFDIDEFKNNEWYFEVYYKTEDKPLFVCDDEEYARDYCERMGEENYICECVFKGYNGYEECLKWAKDKDFEEYMSSI